MNLNNIQIVLVETTHPGNIGGAARAMKNMGLQNLCLVAPKSYPDPKAVWRAASANDVLEHAKVVESLDDAIADCHFVVGTSARQRRIPWPVLDSRGSAAAISQLPENERIAILFGREDRGLTNEQLVLCNLHLQIPTSQDYSSLNIAMAVQIICYDLLIQSRKSEEITHRESDWDSPFSTQVDMKRFYIHLEETLSDIGFLEPAAPRQLMPRLKRLFNRVRLDEMELNILRGILSESQKLARKGAEN